MFWIVFLLGSMLLILKIGSFVMTQDALESINPNKLSLKENIKLIEKEIWKLDGFQFEEFCTMLFALQGLKATNTKKTGDGGKDIILKDKDGYIYVECKHYSEKNKISSPHITKLIGRCAVDNVSRAIFITTSSYTADAINTMQESNNIQVLRYYMNDLLDMAKTDPYYVLNWLDNIA